MPNRLYFTSATVAFFALGFLALPTPAMAGFQWVAPADNNQVMMAPAPVPLAPLSRMPSTATAAPEIISPVIIGDTMPSMSPHAPTPMPMGSVALPAPTTAVTTIGGAVATPSLPSISTLSVAPQSDVVHGFAKQVPLAVALRQILPAGYGFSVDPDVDLGVLVSFQGGKSWRDTLRDALDPAGLAMREQGQMVAVGHIGAGVMAATTPALPPIEQVGTINAPAGGIAPAPIVIDREPAVEQWQAERGDTLHKTIEAWAQRVHIELNWMAEYDYPLQASFSFTGTFEEAVRNLLTGFEDAHPQPIAELHTNPGLGLKVLLVQTRGNSNSN